MLSLVSGLKVRRVRLVFGLRYERHRLVLQVVPVQALEQGVVLQFWGTERETELTFSSNCRFVFLVKSVKENTIKYNFHYNALHYFIILLM